PAQRSYPRARATARMAMDGRRGIKSRATAATIDRMHATIHTDREAFTISPASGWIAMPQKSMNRDGYAGWNDAMRRNAHALTVAAQIAKARRMMRRSARSKAIAEKNINGTRPSMRNFSG